MILILWTIITGQGLQNDHKKIMKEIEEGLHKIHATARERKQENLEERPATNQG